MPTPMHRAKMKSSADSARWVSFSFISFFRLLRYSQRLAGVTDYALIIDSCKQVNLLLCRR